MERFHFNEEFIDLAVLYFIKFHEKNSIILHFSHIIPFFFKVKLSRH